VAGGSTLSTAEALKYCTNGRRNQTLHYQFIFNERCHEYVAEVHHKDPFTERALSVTLSVGNLP
jgi:hypothetical protein